MLDLKKAGHNEAVGLAFRISATAPYGAKASHKLLPSEVIDAHWAVADAQGQVAFSTDVIIDTRANPEISRIFFFANSRDEQFLCQAEVISIRSEEQPFVPEGIAEAVQVPQWRGQPKRTWIFLKDFRQLDIESCGSVLLNKPVLLRDQILVPRFRTCFVKLDEEVKS